MQRTSLGSQVLPCEERALVVFKAACHCHLLTFTAGKQCIVLPFECFHHVLGGEDALIVLTEDCRNCGSHCVEIVCCPETSAQTEHHQDGKRPDYFCPDGSIHSEHYSKIRSVCHSAVVEFALVHRPCLQAESIADDNTIKHTYISQQDH